MQEYIQRQVVEPFIIMRHDVDRRTEMALEMAEMEKDMGMGDVLFKDIFMKIHIIRKN